MKTSTYICTIACFLISCTAAKNVRQDTSAQDTAASLPCSTSEAEKLVENVLKKNGYDNSTLDKETRLKPDSVYQIYLSPRSTTASGGGHTYLVSLKTCKIIYAAGDE